MPLKVLSPIRGANIYLWEITETTEELWNLNGMKENPGLEKLHNADHIKQNIAKSIILNKLELASSLYKTASGKPFLNNGLHISISHSGPWVAIAVAKFPVGIDVERPRKKLLKIAPKFLNAKDAGALRIKNENDLLWYWTGKESAYKLAGIPGLSLKEDILFKELEKQEKTALISLKNQDPVKALYEILPGRSLLCLTFL